MIGIHAYLRHYSGDSRARRLRELLANRLMDEMNRNATPEWPWFEDIVAYDNGRIPHSSLKPTRFVPSIATHEKAPVHSDTGLFFCSPAANLLSCHNDPPEERSR